MKIRYSPVQKIVIAALMLSLATIATIISKMISIPIFRFASVSFAPSLIMFSSFILGPLYGSIVGAASDVLGAFFFPTGAYNPIYTVIAGLWGCLPWLLLFLTKRWRAALRFPIAIYIVLAILLALLGVGFYATDYFSAMGEAGIWLKPLILGLLAAVDIGLCIALHFSNLHFQSQILEYSDIPSPNEVALIATLLQISLGIFATAGALSFYFFVLGSGAYPIGLSFWVIALLLSALATPNILVNSCMVSWLLIFVRRFGHMGNRGENDE